MGLALPKASVGPGSEGRGVWAKQTIAAGALLMSLLLSSYSRTLDADVAGEEIARVPIKLVLSKDGRGVAIGHDQPCW